jgi:hypothetical protein
MEIALFLLGAFLVTVVLLRRSRAGGSSDISPMPLADGDRPADVNTIEVARVHIGSSPGPGGTITGIGGGG